MRHEPRKPGPGRVMHDALVAGCARTLPRKRVRRHGSM